MTIKSLASGHDIYFDGEHWRFKDTNQIVNHERACSCCGEEPIVHEMEGKKFFVDACLSKLVAVFNAAGVPTKMACCGHGRMPGVIILADDRYIGIFKNREQWDELVVEPDETIYGERRAKTHIRFEDVMEIIGNTERSQSWSNKIDAVFWEHVWDVFRQEIRRLSGRPAK